MGLSSPASGIAGLEDCGPKASCIQWCNKTCDNNTAMCAWPHFLEGPGCPNCHVQPNLPSAQSCADTLTFSNPCTGKAIGATLMDCGPNSRCAYNAYCSTSACINAIACINTYAFTYLCSNYCNPATVGLIWVNVS